MPRTNIPVQTLDSKTGEAITFIPIDAANGHEIANSGGVKVLVLTGAGEAVTISIPSQACSHGRLGDLGPFAVGANAYQSFGPYDPTLFGAPGKLYVNASAVTGAPKIAAIAG